LIYRGGRGERRRELFAAKDAAGADESLCGDFTYLTATQLDTGLLLNFGAGRSEFERKSRTYKAVTARQDGQDEQDEQHYGDELTTAELLGLCFC
jgi:hypothetical protein